MSSEFRKRRLHDWYVIREGRAAHPPGRLWDRDGTYVKRRTEREILKRKKTTCSSDEGRIHLKVLLKRVEERPRLFSEPRGRIEKVDVGRTLAS